MAQEFEPAARTGTGWCKAQVQVQRPPIAAHEPFNSDFFPLISPSEAPSPASELRQRRNH
jgi:hypothetical protein